MGTKKKTKSKRRPHPILKGIGDLVSDWLESKMPTLKREYRLYHNGRYLRQKIVFNNQGE